MAEPIPTSTPQKPPQGQEDNFAGRLDVMGDLQGNTYYPDGSVSPANTESKTEQRNDAERGTVEHPNLTQQTTSQVVGNVPAMSAVEPAGSDLSRDVMTRLKAEGRWFGVVEPVRDDMMKACKKRFPNINDRRQWVYGELDRMYPPLGKAHAAGVQTTEKAQFAPSDDGSIQGLNTLPKAWPELPANASLQAEVAWVQANRLRIVTEQMGKATLVKLELALSPAPSWAALGWLETSIRSYAKFVDVAARATSSDDGESAVMKRERMAIEEMKTLLAEMDQPASGI
jgi:hypothetical protein